MGFASGDKLGPYEIVEPIGKGGMGEVYRARDPRMGREVAIKVSAERFSERFSREVHAVAALNHPNVCTLYDVGSDYLVMELIEGPTLAERIALGALPLEESLHIARQIGSALEAAHEKGIVHRDLKPGNVKIKPDGIVKVLDFGLAKIGGTPTAQGEDSPTISMHATQAGVILGTAAYMAPEQARGKTVDKRADIWAFGVVLHEMLTGRRLFQGEDLTETLASVVMKAPDLDGVPRRVRPLLQSCLEKDPSKRLRDIGDAWRLLADDVETPTAPQPTSGRRWMWPAAFAVMTLAALVALWAPWREPPAAPELVRFEIAPPAGGSIQKFSLSPDGRKVAFFVSGGAQTGLWVRSLDDPAPVRIVDSSEALTVPSFFWSADSRRVAFPGGSSLNRLMVADFEGGRPETLAEVSTIVAGGSWSPEGTILFGSTAPGGVWRTSPSGGEPVQLTADDRGAIGHFSPILLPDGKRFLYLALYSSAGEDGIYLGSIDAKPSEQSRERVLATTFAVDFVPGPDPSLGYLLFLRDDALLAQKLDLSTFQLTGAPARIASGVGSQIEFGSFSTSDNGVLIYHATSSGTFDLVTLAWFDRAGKAQGATPLAGGGQNGVALSPDGTRAAVGWLDPRTGNDVWVVDFARNGAFSRVTSGPGRHHDPVWSPDGNQIAYAVRDEKGSVLARRSSSGSGEEQVVAPANGKLRELNHWSRDGRFLLYSEEGETTKADLWVAPAAGGKPEVVLNSAFNETAGQFSPDGRWIAYVSDETGQSGIYVQPFPPAAGKGDKIVVSTDGGVMPRWRRDGKELFYAVVKGGYTTVVAVDFTSSPAARAGIPRELFRGPIASVNSRFFNWDVTPLGDRFLLTALPEINAGAAPLTVVLNWQRLLEE